MTQEQLGFELNVTKASVSAWENGREAPGFRLLPKLREVVGVSLDELLCGADSAGALAEPYHAYGAEVRSETEAALLRAFRRLSVKRRQGLLDLIE
ncbi:helix-turn-helix domain-containing protein [Alcanivorax sp. CY1518]|uniref:Helix-turn-helix domain-containing protein n=2 Tax=Alcanivorax quisquiliarum TaxID=2933565 RepID=A0ABT0E8D0_9GAMM|nr:helix-turn-helix domain-containing protein [Alcanivorax quisquiliarum]